MVVRREANGVGVPVSPRKGLDCVCWIIQSRSQDSAVADPLPNQTRERVEERRYCSARLLLAEGGIAARSQLGRSKARNEDVVAELDVLARNVRLILAAAVVEPNDPAVGRRPLR